MNSMDPTIPVLDEHNAGFIQKYVSINMAARDNHNVPAVSRAFGCRLGADRSQVMVYICAAGNDRLMRNLRSNGIIAVVFSRPTSHETLQLKATDASIVQTLTDHDHEIIHAYRQSMIEELASIGYAEAFVRALVPETDAIRHGVLFTPQQAFVQTPGPKAGHRIT